MAKVMVTRPVKAGRPSLFTETDKDKIVARYNKGETQRSIADDFDVSIGTIQHILRERRKKENFI